MKAETFTTASSRSIGKPPMWGQRRNHQCLYWIFSTQPSDARRHTKPVIGSHPYQLARRVVERSQSRSRAWRGKVFRPRAGLAREQTVLRCRNAGRVGTFTCPLTQQCCILSAFERRFSLFYRTRLCWTTLYWASFCLHSLTAHPDPAILYLIAPQYGVSNNNGVDLKASSHCSLPWTRTLHRD